MLPDFFSHNMAILKQINPRLEEELAKSNEGLEAPSNGEELKIEEASSGAPTLVYKGIHVHSRRDPEREAKRLVDEAVSGSKTNNYDTDITPAVILGFGLGYAAVALAEKFPERPVIVAEKHPFLLLTALKTRDFSKLLSRPALVFVLGGSGDGITGALSLFESTPGVPPVIIKNMALAGMDEDWYNGVESKIKSWGNRTSVNLATKKRFGKRWVRNLSVNLKTVRDIPGISMLKGMLGENAGNPDIPVFLAAAGPTLDEVSPFLDKIKERCLIVAVDTSLRFLLRRNVDPDFVVSVDPQFWNFRHLDRADSPKTCLVAESAVYPPVLRHRFERIFLCSSFFPLGRFIEERVDRKGDLGAGGSVATSAWDFIRILGAVNIWIAGLDLSFPELKTHFRDASFEEKSHSLSGRFMPGETWNFRVLRDGHPFHAKRQAGGTVLTDKRLSLYASWFENRFSQYPEIKNKCLSGDGLAIPGLITSQIDELLALPKRRPEADFLLKETYAAIERDFNNDDSRKNRSQDYNNALKALLEGIKEIKNLALSAAQNSSMAASRSRQGRLGEKEEANILKMLDSVNKTIMESNVKEIAGFLFPDTEEWDEETGSANETPLVRHLEYSARFYNALAEAAGFNLQILDDNFLK